MTGNVQGSEFAKFNAQELSAIRPSSAIPNGSLVKGLVLEKRGDGYIVEIQGQRMYAASSLDLEVGERFVGIWDSTHIPPLLKIKQDEMALHQKLTDFERSILHALLDRQLPVTEGLIKALSSLLMKMASSDDNLSILIELYARGLPLDEANVKTLSWYLGLTDVEIRKYEKHIKDTLKNPKEMKDSEATAYLKSLLLLARPLKNVIYPYNFLPLLFHLDGDKSVKIWISSQEEPKKAVKLLFHFEGHNIGLVEGELVFADDAYGVTLRPKSDVVKELISKELSHLDKALKSLSLQLIYLNLGPMKEIRNVAYQGFEAEA